MMNLPNNHPALRRFTLSLGTAVMMLFAVSAKSQDTNPLPQELKVLLDRTAIEDMMVDYYAQIGSDNHDYSKYYTADGRLEVNGLIAKGKTEMTGLYDRASGGIDESMSSSDNKVPPGRFDMVMSNLKIAVRGDTAVATMLWYSIVSPKLTDPPSVTEHGHDHTDLVKQNGRWLITRRVVTSDGGMPEGLLESFLNRSKEK